MDADCIRKTIEFKAPLSRVWKALSDSRQFGEWFQARLEGPFVSGQITRGVITTPGYEGLAMDLHVEAVEPERRLAFRWHPYAVDTKADYKNEPLTLVEFVLEPTSTGTRLSVTESGFEAVPAARRAEAFRMNDQGWAEQVKNIEKYVSATS